MKLFTFSREGEAASHLGFYDGETHFDLSRAGHGTPATFTQLLDGGAEALENIRAFAASPARAAALPEAGWQFGPCVVAPEKIICVGLNYHRHARESGLEAPTTPTLFSKFNNSLAAHREPVPLPESATQYDYEVELGFVLGRTARDVSVDDALDYVLGYCTIDDLSARDLQTRTSQWLLGKTLDKFMPIGPYLVTADEVLDPQQLTLRCWVNGEERQHSSTADMIFSVAEVISYTSRHMTLRPGDVFTTGTPEGVILGMKTQRWLQPGDEVTVEVEGLGRLTNILVAAAS